MAEIPVTQKMEADEAARAGDVTALAGFLRRCNDQRQLKEWYAHAGYDSANRDEVNARQIIAHTHYFDTWAAYQRFSEDMQDEGAALWQFEQAADAIAAGDTIMLKQRLAANPGLITMRSARNHHSTLLNYVGANGFEHWRQKTPKNAVEIAAILLSAGAEVDAWGDMYRGTSTLGLVATSVHPVITGVQEELMDVLVRRGADPNHAVAPDYTDGLLILTCLHNGRYEPIHYLATHGADVDLEAAGGLGDLERVKSYFNERGELMDASLETKRNGGMIWACVYGHLSIVQYLLNTGMSVNTRWDGTTPLHSAAFGGQIAIVRLLMEKGADMELLNEYGGTVLGTTLWALYNARKPAHLEIMETLIAAGAKINEGWQVYIDEQRETR